MAHYSDKNGGEKKNTSKTKVRFHFVIKIKNKLLYLLLKKQLACLIIKEELSRQTRHLCSAAVKFRLHFLTRLHIAKSRGKGTCIHAGKWSTQTTSRNTNGSTAYRSVLWTCLYLTASNRKRKWSVRGGIFCA